MWPRVAPTLAERFSVVGPDLRGYGRSEGPDEIRTEHYTKRAMGQDVVQLMDALGYDRFTVAGHDRGGRVAYHLALDQPQLVDRLAVLDVIPTLENYERATWQRANEIFVSYFYPQPYPYPETLIGNAPDYHLEYLLEHGSQTDDPFAEAAVAEYREAIHDARTLRTMMEGYRAGFYFDTKFDQEDREAGNIIERPSLAMYTASKALTGVDPSVVWQDWMSNVQGETIDAGHFFPQEAPEETAGVLDAHFTSD